MATNIIEFYYKENNGIAVDTKNELLTLHREDGPAIYIRHEEQACYISEWYLDGKRHREGGPAALRYDMKGILAIEEWWHFGALHREDGPAKVIHFSKDMKQESWFLEGKKIEK